MKITNAALKQAMDAVRIKSSETGRPERVRVYDSEVRGFGATVHGSGVTFFVQYGGAHNRKRLTLGTANAMSLDEARKRARIQLGKVADGDDPAAERKAKRQALTFGDAVDTYLAAVARRKKQPRHDRQYLGGDAKKRWGTRALASITRADVEAAMHDVAAKAAKRGGTGHTTANRWLASVHKFFADAVEAGTLAANPATVRKFAEGVPRARTLNDQEYVAVLDAIDALPEHPRVAFRLLLETGARKSEALGARWEDFDLDDATWRIPSPKAGRPQTIPLGGDSVTLLRATSRVHGNPFVFPGRDHSGQPGVPQHRADLRNEWDEVRAAAGIADVTMHDLRRTFGKRVRQAAGLQAASKLLRHADIRVTERVYAAMDVEEQRAGLAATHAATKSAVKRERDSK